MPVIEQQGNEYRYERKFLVEQLQPDEVKYHMRLHPSLFREPFPPRFINNLYLDSDIMENYYDNVHGATNRRKVRIRWYGELFGEIQKPILEYKIKRGMVGTKRQYALPTMKIDECFSAEYFQSIVKNADLPDDVKWHLRMMNVVLMNRYFRYYFATFDNRFRVTLDTAMTFHQIEQLRNTFLHHQGNYRTFVVELKYGVDEDNEAQRISTFFPFRVNKSSKYVQGIERVYF